MEIIIISTSLILHRLNVLCNVYFILCAKSDESVCVRVTFFEIQPMISKFFFLLSFHLSVSIVFMYAHNTNTLICCWSLSSYLNIKRIRLTRVLERTVLLLALIQVKDIALNEFKVKLLLENLAPSNFTIFFPICLYVRFLLLLVMVATPVLVAIMVLHCTVI